MIAIAVMVPSVYLFINLLDQQVFENKTREFVKNIIRYEGAEVVKFTHDYKSKNLDVYLIGRPVPQNKINDWLAELEKTENLEKTKLRIYQGADQSGEMAAKLSTEIKAGILEDLYVKNAQIIQDKDEKIQFLENEIANIKVRNVPFKQLSEEVKLNYEGLETFSYSNRISTNFQKTDTLPVINISWKKSVTLKQRRAESQKIQAWLKYKLKLDTLEVSSQP